MPIVQIHLLSGRSEKKKRKLVAAVTEAIVSTVDVPPEKVRIILSDMKPENYAVAGVLTLDAPKAKKAKPAKAPRAVGRKKKIR
ncbi:MAG: 2-hydroxymuconate tautomerase family protein [Alphaproteobacteria bacterium]|nr:2-hydroxymuconate tautomerase family protein [Alphaproteobacteria bacterium]